MGDNNDLDIISEVKLLDKNGVSEWEKVDMHLGVFGKLPDEESSSKYKTEKELAELYKKAPMEEVINNLPDGSEQYFHLYYQANSILGRH